LNGEDDKFSLGLSNGNEPISKWIIQRSQIINVVDEPKDQQPAVEDQKETLTVEKEEMILLDKGEESVETNQETEITTTTTISTSDSGYDISNQIVKEESASSTTAAVVGEKRKHEEEKEEEEKPQVIIPNTFKKLKSEEGCQNGK
jgi:hypothetical protein